MAQLGRQLRLGSASWQGRPVPPSPATQPYEEGCPSHYTAAILVALLLCALPLCRDNTIRQ